MNNTPIFTPPTAKADTSAHKQDFKTPRLFDGPAQPFSNVLERAVQAPNRLKHDSLTGGRSAERRSERSIEAHDEGKPSAPPRATKRKDKRDEPDTVQPAVCAGMPTPVLPLLPTVQVSAPGEADSIITVADISDMAAKTDEEVVASFAPESDMAADVLTTGKALPASLPEGNGVEAFSAINPEPLPKMMTIASDAADAKALAVSPLSVSTAREVAANASIEESDSNPNKENIESASGAVVADAMLPDESRLGVRAARRAWAESHENDRGTGGAKMTVSMNNAVKKEDVAGLTQQVLPGVQAVQIASMKTLPGESHRSIGGEISNVDALSASARMVSGLTAADESVSGDMLEMRGASPAVRMGEVISREVRMFKRGGDDLVEVILTPDAKTQITLKLQWRDGQVEVQARCDMGDHRSLNNEWSQLQASLATNGVRLSHLSERVQTGFTEFFSNSGFSQQRGGERHSASPQSTADGVTPSVVQPAKSGVGKSPTRPNRRLESWA